MAPFRSDLAASPRLVAALVFGAAAATIAGALAFEHGAGLRPCKLCLMQRNPYYAGMALALLVTLLPLGRALQRLALGLLAVLFVISAGLGAYHAGVEWGWWAGPNDCGGAVAPTAGSVADFMNSLQTTRVVSCTEAPWRFLGLSLAGWNVVISLAIAGLAGAALWSRSPRASDA